jgi:hypothetical protein
MSLLRRRTTEDTPEALRGVVSTITMITGVRVTVPDLERLDEAELDNLRNLTRKVAEPSTPGSKVMNLQLLSDRERKRWMALIEKAAGRPGLFAERREDASLKAQLAAIARSLNQPGPRQRFEEPGAVVLPKLWIHDWLREPAILELQHVAVLAFVLSELDNAEPVGPASHLENGGQTLVIDARMGLFPGRLDPDGRLSNWKKLVSHLEVNKLLQVERRGHEWRISRGIRAVQAIEDRAAA